MKIIVLGAGLVGGPMAIDLAAESGRQVSLADRDEQRLVELAARAPITPVVRDLSDPAAVTRLVADHDFVVSAVPGFLGYRTLEAILEAGKNVVDIAFFPEDPFDLDNLARSRGVIAITDCGVFPGMGSALIGRAARRLDEVTDVLTYVGGLPDERRPPWEYRAVFSPVDVIEEYTRPARYVENGEIVVRPALSDPEPVHLPEVGELEAFNTDGLRTLIRTIGAPNMKEKTLRYPGHAAKMALLRDAGFFGTGPVDVNGASIRPLDLTAQLLFPAWKLEPGESEFTVLRIDVTGRREGRRLRYRYDLLDRYDAATDTTSMARTTGYTATAAVRLVAAGLYREAGISPPEYLGRVPGCVPFLLERLAERGVHYHETIDELDG